MKKLLGIFLVLVASLASAVYGQDPLITGNDYIQSSVKCPLNKFDPNASKDMNNTMDMNNPLYMENGTLGDQSFNRNSDFNSNPDNFNSRDMNIQTIASSNQCPSDARSTLNDIGTKSKKGISNGWNKLKHNKLTKHLFNQSSNS